MADRVHEAGLGIQETEQGLLVHDPSQNGLVLTVAKKPQLEKAGMLK